MSGSLSPTKPPYPGRFTLDYGHLTTRSMSPSISPSHFVRYLRYYSTLQVHTLIHNRDHLFTWLSLTPHLVRPATIHFLASPSLLAALVGRYCAALIAEP